MSVQPQSGLHLAAPMRRLALQAFRTARLNPVRRLARSPSAPLFASNHVLSSRAAFSSRSTSSFIPAVLQSSMLFRNASLAFISTLVASGAWYAYKGTSRQQDLSTGSGVSTAAPLLKTSDIYSGTVIPTGPAEHPTLVVEDDKFFASTPVSDQPVSKQTSESGNKAVGMLTPEQATEKLRRSEESYFVGRGKGVVRYDVVQLPSNDPIEDDHAEKIIVSAAEDGSTSDWMFWGVFDGHS